MKKGWDEIEERFRSKVWVEADDCWLWMAARDDHGYGYYWDGKRKRVRIATRFIYEQMVGPIPAGMHVLHRCDNPPCVRVDHLFVGDQVDNNRDCLEKGRVAAGEAHGHAKLERNQVEMIRHIYEEMEVSQQYLARIYGISRGTVGNIIRRETWRT